ncbi:MAG: histidine phosphatase family protein [Clostridia bacterium]|nr:histidine phosphatase family protein [Clostridia bacterium]
MQSYRIHLIRNGTTQSNLEAKYCGSTDESLCEQGAAEIYYLKDTYAYPMTEYVFTSPLKRCMETASIIYPTMPSAVIDELRECDFGDFEGKTADELKGNPAYKQWLQGDADACPPNGESNRSFADRVCGGFCKVVDGMMRSGVHDTAIVTHGGVIMAILSAFGIPQMPMSEWLTPAGCGYTILLNPGLWASHKKFEVYCDIPERPLSADQEAELWDWYPEDAE